MEARPLRILYHHRTAALDGMRVHIDALVEALRARGHDVLVVGPESAAGAGGAPGGGWERLADRLRALLPAACFELLELVYNIPAYRRLSRAARAFAPDILYERYNLFLLAGLWLKRRRRIPMILEVNAPLAAERAEFGNLRLKALARACEGTVWRNADAVLPVTQVLADIVRARRGTEEGLHVVPNGADLSRHAAADADLRRRLGLEGALVLGFVGFVRPWHGLEWAIRSLDALPSETRLLVIGDGPARAALEAEAAACGVAARVHFAGRIPHDEVSAYMRLFDVALQTRAVAYASPLKLFEYMALGLAIVAPDQPNIREVLRHDANALLFDADSEAAFAAVLVRLCRDQELRERLGRAARATVEDTPFTWAHNGVRVERIARALLAHATPIAIQGADPARRSGAA